MGQALTGSSSFNEQLWFQRRKRWTALSLASWREISITLIDLGNRGKTHPFRHFHNCFHACTRVCIFRGLGSRSYTSRQSSKERS